ncbi:hypothetical protein HT105_23415, partial [Bacteroides fragilis]|nr:hypothetical protein [Bacteroides fragilis]
GADVTSDDIFHFVYGKLHDPNYREIYAGDLKKMLPHIETRRRGRGSTSWLPRPGAHGSAQGQHHR